MAPLVRALLVLTHLAVTVVSEHGLTHMEDKYQSESCKKLMRMILWCGYEKDWKNALQRKMAEHMGSTDFSTEVDKCLATSLDPSEDMSYCTDIKSLRVYLMCSRETLFAKAEISMKFAALMFHRGFEHCVKVNMGMMEEDLELSSDTDMSFSDDDEYDDELDPDEVDTPERRGGEEYDDKRNNRHNHRGKPGHPYARPVRHRDYNKPTRPYHEDFRHYNKPTRPYHEDIRHKKRPPHDHDDFLANDEWLDERKRHKWQNDRNVNRHNRRPKVDIGVSKRRHRRPLGNRDTMNRHDGH
ncbi:hypothetical protein MTO96_033412 [Rhipicephalus appendiculatus]